MNYEFRRVVLIISRSVELLDFSKNILRKNFHVVETGNGEEGLALARKINPDLVLCDIVVPLLTGLEICGRLKSDFATSHMSVILMGAVEAGFHEIDGLLAGADDFIHTPFDSKVLELKIDNLIRLRAVLQAQYICNIPSMSGSDELLYGGFIEKLRKLVFDNISDPDFGVHKMAFLIGISVSVLYRKLRSLTGITVNEFVKTIRMKRAMQLLEAGTYHVNEVANAVGYEDSKYFSKEFRKTFGKTPTEIKRRIS